MAGTPVPFPLLPLRSMEDNPGRVSYITHSMPRLNAIHKFPSLMAGTYEGHRRIPFRKQGNRPGSRPPAGFLLIPTLCSPISPRSLSTAPDRHPWAAGILPTNPSPESVPLMTPSHSIQESHAGKRTVCPNPRRCAILEANPGKEKENNGIQDQKFYRQRGK